MLFFELSIELQKDEYDEFFIFGTDGNFYIDYSVAFYGMDGY